MITDFEIPKKYGLRQTIADTIGIGGIFRVLRTLPVMLDFARDMEKVCPNAWLLNYTNPMCALTGGILRQTDVKAVGLCHSVQVCATTLLRNLDMLDEVKDLQWKIAGINHMAWLLEITDGGKDLYPEIRSARERSSRLAQRPREKFRHGPPLHDAQLRLLHHGIFEHLSEYVPYFIKSNYPQLVEEFNIPLDEYPAALCEPDRSLERPKEIAARREPHAQSHA